jgi:single-stranded-DNA-specific exonuclease
VELLTEFDFEQAQQFASEIEQYNSTVKDLDKIIKKVYCKLKKQERKVHNCGTKDWHKGVSGCRLRLIETYYDLRLFYQSDKYAASARSVKGFDVYNACWKPRNI